MKARDVAVTVGLGAALSCVVMAALLIISYQSTLRDYEAWMDGLADQADRWMEEAKNLSAELEAARLTVSMVADDYNELQDDYWQLQDAYLNLSREVDAVRNALYSQWANAVYYRSLLEERGVAFNWTEPFDSYLTERGIDQDFVSGLFNVTLAYVADYYNLTTSEGG